MPHLTCMRGLPASGKTTRARLIAEQTGAVVVGRDFLRHMLFNTYMPPGQEAEETVTAVETAAVRTLLKSGSDVIIDNTHLQARYLKQWAKVASETGSTFSIRDVHTSLEECIARDAVRDRTVGEPVIRRMARRAQYPTVTAPYPINLHQPVEWVDGLPTAIIVDIDGTIAHMVDRSPYDYSQVSTDIVDETIVALIETWDHGSFYSSGRYPQIILCSGRDDSCRTETADWLADNGIRYSHLLMRPVDSVDNNGNKLPDWQVKLALFNKHVRDKYNVAFVLDDRKTVVDMWRNVLGLKCLQVEPGDF